MKNLVQFTLSNYTPISGALASELLVLALKLTFVCMVDESGSVQTLPHCSNVKCSTGHATAVALKLTLT